MEITIQSDIKGIHHFKVWPHSEIPMLVEKENGNRWDRHAMTVSYPAFKDIPSSLRHEWARIPDNDKVGQRVDENAGKVVGRVPANLCGLFRKYIDKQKVKRIVCLALSGPGSSKNPHIHQRFRKSSQGRDRRGGGLVVGCKYVLHLFQSVDKAKFIDEVKTDIKEIGGSDLLLL